jgi:hypothetical protein
MGKIVKMRSGEAKRRRAGARKVVESVGSSLSVCTRADATALTRKLTRSDFTGFSHLLNNRRRYPALT